MRELMVLIISVLSMVNISHAIPNDVNDHSTVNLAALAPNYLGPMN